MSRAADTLRGVETVRGADRMKVPGSGDIVEYARRLGWPRALMRGAYVAANQVAAVSIFDCFCLRPQDINQSLITPEHGFECRFLTRGEIEAMARPAADPASAGEPMARILGEALVRGDDAFAILHEGRLASIGLYATNPTPVLNDLIVHFERPARYMYRGYTPVEYRGRRLHALGILRAGLELFERGVPQLVTVCERTNYPATISVFRMGWQPRGAIFRVAVGSWARLGRTAAAAGIGMHLEPWQRG